VAWGFRLFNFRISLLRWLAPSLLFGLHLLNQFGALFIISWQLFSRRLRSMRYLYRYPPSGFWPLLYKRGIIWSTLRFTLLKYFNFLIRLMKLVDLPIYSLISIINGCVVRLRLLLLQKLMIISPLLIQLIDPLLSQLNPLTFQVIKHRCCLYLWI
jgi:hypothetical protein